MKKTKTESGKEKGGKWKVGTQYTAQKKYDFLRNCFDAAKQRGISLDEKKLIAQFQIKFASTARTARELIKTFETAGYIMRRGGEIASPELFEEELGIKPEEQKTIGESA